MISRFFATTGTLTPALLFSDSRAGLPGSLLPELPDIPSPTTPCAPAFRLCFLLRAGLASDSLRQLSAVLRISLIMCSLISRIRPNRVRRARLSSASSLRAVRSLSVALHEASLARSYFPLLAGSSAKEGLAPSRSSMLPGAHMPLLWSLAARGGIVSMDGSAVTRVYFVLLDRNNSPFPLPLIKICKKCHFHG
jgi:hypothetical protein